MIIVSRLERAFNRARLELFEVGLLDEGERAVRKKQRQLGLRAVDRGQDNGGRDA